MVFAAFVGVFLSHIAKSACFVQYVTDNFFFLDFDENKKR